MTTTELEEINTEIGEWMACIRKAVKHVRVLSSKADRIDPKTRGRRGREVQRLIGFCVSHAGNQAILADHLHVTKAYISLILDGRRKGYNLLPFLVSYLEENEIDPDTLQSKVKG